MRRNMRLPEIPLNRGFVYIKTAGSLVSVLWLFFILSACSGNTAETPSKDLSLSAKPLPVKVAPVVTQDVPIELRAVGLAEPFAQVEIRSQVTGILKRVGFREGDRVKVGDQLFSIDERPFSSRLAQARAALATDRAELSNARKQVDRYLPIAAKGYLSTEQLDSAQTRVAALEATVLADEAEVENARLDLDYCTIHSPLSGRTGEVLPDPGDLVKALADEPLVTINQTSPIRVSFTLPEKTLPEINKHLAAGDMQVSVENADETLFGKLSFVDNQVNSQTGSIRLKADFPNDSMLLWPGQFVNVRLRLTVRKEALVVPTRAVQASQTGAFVYVVGPDQRVEQRPVTVAFSDGDQTVIDAGLNVGEILVTDGQLRLRAGAAVILLEGSAVNPAAASRVGQ